MQKARRLLSVFLALTMLLSITVFPADAADSDYEVSVLSVQKLTRGTRFDPDTAEEVTNAQQGDVVVLTIGARNNSATALTLAGFAVKLNFDNTKVTPYPRDNNETGTAPFSLRPYQTNAALTSQEEGLAWSGAGNASNDANDANAPAEWFSLGYGGTNYYNLAPGEELFLCRVAVTVEAEDAVATFTFDTANDATDLIGVDGSLGIDTPASFRLPIGAGTEDPNPPEPASDYQIYVSKVQQLTEGTRFTGASEPEIAAARTGNIVVLTINGKNNTDTAITLAGFAVKLKFDNTKVTPYPRDSSETGTAPFSLRPYQTNAALTSEEEGLAWSGASNVSNDANDANAPAEWFSFGYGGSNYYNLAPGEELFLCRVAVRVNSEEGGSTTFTFDTTDDATDLTGVDGSLGIGTPADYTLILGELTPTTVAVTPDRATLNVPDGDTPATQAFTATVQDQGGNTIPNASVTWSMTPDNVAGVSMENGTVSVTSSAAVTEATTFTITATSSGINSNEAKLTVNPAAGNDLSATLDDQTQQTVTPDGENDRTFRAAVTSQSGADTSGVQWSVEVEAEDGTRSAPPDTSGVSVDETGLVTVAKDAVPGKYYVVARLGESSAEVPVTVQGSAVTSLTLDPAEATFTVTADADPASLVFPLSDTFTVTDNTGAAVDAASLTWTLSETPDGVTLDNGTVTVDKDAFTGTHTVTVTAALSENVSGTAQLKIQQVIAAPVLDHVELSNATSVVDTMTAEPDRITATAVGDIEGILDNITWSVTPPAGAPADAEGVSLSADSGELVTLTVSPNAEIGDYTITATQSRQEGEPIVKAATLTVSYRRASNMTVTGSRASIEIPGSGAPDEIARFTATDSNGSPIRSDDLTWSVVDRATGTELRRTSVDWATDPEHIGSILLTVKPLAREEIFDTHDASGVTGKTLVVTANRTSTGDSASTTVVVRRADSVLSIVTLTLGEQSTSTGQAPLPVSSTGNGPQYVTAVAKDQYEQVLDSSITWDLRSGGGGLVISGSGVEINQNTGLVTVGNSAQHGTYIVEARRKILEREQVASAEMTISQVAEAATSLRISGGVLEMKVPGKNDEPNVLPETSAFVAQVLNQYGRVMPDAEIFWNITNSAGATVEGVTIEDGRVQVSYAAKNAIGANDRPTFTVRASCGNVEGTASIYITRDTPYLADLLLEGQNSLTVSVDGTQDSAVQASALDQYETPYAGTVTWAVTPDGIGGDGGVRIDASGLITVLRNAYQGYYNVTAAEGANPAVGPKRLLVSRDAPYPASVIISGGQPTIWIPGDNSAPAQSVPFTASVRDQFGSEMTGQNVLWTVTDRNGAAITGITIENGVVSVTNEVKAVIPSSNYVDFRTMNVGASCGSVSAVPGQIIVGRDRPTLSKVQLDGNDSTTENRASFNYTDGQTMTITATALDQYGAIFRNASWSLFSYTDRIGVNIDPASGIITVSNGAVSGEYTAIATYNDVEVSAPFLIRKVGSANTALNRVVVDPETVTISSTNMAVSRATAYDGDGNQITSGLIWSVFPESRGVSVDAQGWITVSSSAAPRIYVISATPDSAFGTVSGTAKYADLNVESASAATAELDHIALTKSAVTVDGTAGDTSNAYAYDQNDREVTGVTWTVAPADGGVGIDANGRITIFHSATAGDYTITATKNGVRREATLSVTNNAAAAITGVVLTPATVAVDGITTASSVARAVGNGGATIPDVSWSVVPNDKGVTIAANGAITIEGNAMIGPYEIRASNSAGTRSATLTVTEQSAPAETLTGVTLTPSTVILDGTAKTVNAAAQGTVTDGITWTVTPSDGAVSVERTSGRTAQLTISASAAAGTTYTVTATHGDETRRATLRLTSTPANPSTLTGVTVSPASVTVNGTAAQSATAAATPADASGIAWSVTPLGNGVSINALTGVVTVAATAKSGEYAVTATQGTESRSATLTVSNATPATTVTLDSVTLSPASVTLSGAAASSTATAVSSGNAPLTTGVIWSVSPTGGGVSVDTSGHITIAATAVSGDYTVSATYNAVTRSATLAVNSDAEIVYEETPVDQSAVSGTPLATIEYADTGVRSVEGRSILKSAALSSQTVQQAVAQQPDGTETDIVVSVEIALRSYDAENSTMRLSVTPVYEIVRTSNGNTTTLPGGTLSELSSPVTVSLNVPAGFDATFARHTHNNITYLEPITYTGSASNRVASWSQQYFSDVELTKDAVTVAFNSSGGTPVNSVHIARGGTLPLLPSTVRVGYNFVGWFLNGVQVTPATVFNENATLVAQWLSTGNSTGNSTGGGGGGGSGGGNSTGSSTGSTSSSNTSYTVKLTSGSGGSLSASARRAKAGTTVTITPAPNTGYELDEFTVQTSSTKKDVEVTPEGGNYTFEMPRNSVTVSATFRRIQTPANTDNGNNGNTNPTPVNPGPSYSSVSFVDMQPDNFFYTAVQWAVERGITNGTTATTFSPNQACTRAQMVMFLWRSQGMPMPSSYNSPFVDVDPSANYYPAMMWAVERGITNGTTPTTFDPYAACTRAQMVMFLHRVAGRPRPTQWACPFTDITVGENYYEPMLWALERGITNGTTATTFSPYQACTRAQMVMFLYRYLGGN